MAADRGEGAVKIGPTPASLLMSRPLRRWISGFTLAGAAGLLASGFLGNPFGTSPAPGQRLRVERAERGLASVPIGREQEVVFRVTNAGDAPLEIVGMSRS
jgi:hypothetical protein